MACVTFCLLLVSEEWEFEGDLLQSGYWFGKSKRVGICGAELWQSFPMRLSPRFKLGYCLAQERQFDLAVQVVGILIATVAHEFHSNIFDHPCLDQAGVEGGPQVLKAELSDTGLLQGGFPCSLYAADWIIAERENQAAGFSIDRKHFKQSGSQRHFP